MFMIWSPGAEYSAHGEWQEQKSWEYPHFSHFLTASAVFSITDGTKIEELDLFIQKITSVIIPVSKRCLTSDIQKDRHLCNWCGSRKVKKACIANSRSTAEQGHLPELWFLYLLYHSYEDNPTEKSFNPTTFLILWNTLFLFGLQIEAFLYVYSFIPQTITEESKQIFSF